jgi:hypothetical protein
MQPLPILLGNIDTALLPSEQTLDFVTQANVFLPIYVGLLLLTGAGVWATFVKAGQPGWTCIIPFYNLVVLLKIVRKHPLSVLFMFVPLVNVVFACVIAIRLAQLFGKGHGFGVGLVFFPFICYPIIGFGAAKYQAHGVATKGVSPPGDEPATSQLQSRRAA